MVLVYYQNVRRVRMKKKDEFFLRVLGSAFDVVCLTQSWPMTDISTHLLFPEDYKVHRSEWPLSAAKSGGGTLVAVRRTLGSKRRRYLEHWFESTWVEITSSSGTPTLVGTVYIPPEPREKILKEFCQFLTDELTRYEGNVIVVGDFNCPDHHAKVYSLLRHAFGMHAVVQFNRVVNNYGRLLDLVWCSHRLKTEVAQSGFPLVPEDGYHPALEFNLPLPLRPACAIEKSLQDVDSAFTIDWRQVLTSEDPGGAAELFVRKLADSARKPEYQLLIKSRSPVATMFSSSRVRRLRSLKRKHHRRYQRSGNRSHLEKTLHYDRLLESEVVDTRDFFLRNVVSSSPQCLSWARSMGLDAEGEERLDPDDFPFASPEMVAEKLSRRFRKCFSARTTRDSQVNGGHPNMGIPRFEEDDIRSAIDDLEDSVCPGPDGVPSRLLKLCRDSLVAPLRHVVNLSFSHGRYPKVWKSAYVHPVHTDGSRSDLDNYRPVYEQSACAQILDILAVKHIKRGYLNFVHQGQHAHRPGKSPETDLLEFKKCVSDILGADELLEAVYLKLPTAFDGVDHRLVLEGLQSVGCHSAVIRWFRSYLKGRSYRVLIDGQCSSPFVPLSGVPRDSILGSMLLCITLNPVLGVVKDCHALMCVDELKIFRRVTLASHWGKVQADIRAVEGWCRTNGFVIDCEKSVCVSYSCQMNHILLKLKLYDKYLTREEDMTDLGVLFTESLCFAPHIENISESARAMADKIACACTHCHSWPLPVFLFRTYVKPLLTRGSAIWKESSDPRESPLHLVGRYFVRALSSEGVPTRGAFDAILDPKWHLTEATLQESIGGYWMM